jgi:hypothetical protein
MADQEQRVHLLFRNIENEFQAFERMENASRAEAKLRTITGMLRDCKTCVLLASSSAVLSLQTYPLDLILTYRDVERIADPEYSD